MESPRICCLDLDTFCKLDHLIVSAAGDLRGAIDAALALIGRRRHVAAAMPQFLAVLASVAQSDCIASVPEQLARLHARRFGLDVFAPPLETPPFEICALKAAFAADPAVDWLIGLLAPV